jgi:hypothetical protein
MAKTAPFFRRLASGLFRNDEEDGPRPGTPLRRERLPRDETALAPAEGSRAVEVLQWFSKGYWTAEAHPEGPLFFDWRFGETRRPGPLGPDNPPRPLFTWQLRPDGRGGWKFVPIQVPGEPRAATLPLVWRRLRGEPVL